ncbi:putative hydrolase, partial [Coniochaeta sp. 2T2.1]
MTNMTNLHTKIAIQHVTVFDGKQLQGDKTVAFENGLIVPDTSGAETIIDAHGAFLFPGLIDCHAHVHAADDLFLMAQHGVTTCLDMGTKDLTLFQGLRGGVGNCDIRSAGIPAMPPGSRLTSKPGFPRRLIVAGPEDAKRFVADRISDGADYIKVMLEAEGPDQATVDAVVAEAHAQERLVIAHATTCETVEKAVEAKVDVATHVPQDKPLSDESVTKIKAAGTVFVLTLVKMVATAAKESKLDYAHSKSSAISIRQAGVTILAGTDANKHASGAGKVSYGDSMWEELRLLVEVGLSPLEALQSATSLPAHFFGLGDRGVIELGKRADLILLSKDPLQDIGNITSIQRVWCGGVEV